MKGSQYVQKSERADLSFPVGRIGSMLRKGPYAERVSELASVCLAAVLESLVFELLEHSVDTMKQQERLRVQPIDIHQAIEHNEDLHQLFQQNSIQIPLYKKKQKRAKKQLKNQQK